jgi:hypothetical protein
MKIGDVVKEGKVFGKIYHLGSLDDHGNEHSVWCSWRDSVEDAKDVKYNENEKPASRGGRLTWSPENEVAVVEEVKK